MPQPFGYRVAVKALPGEEKTQSGIVIPGQKANHKRGLIEAVGVPDPGAALQDLDIGDTIWWTEGHEQEIQTVDEHGTNTTMFVDLACIVAYEKG